MPEPEQGSPPSTLLLNSPHIGLRGDQLISLLEKFALELVLKTEGF